MENVIQRSRVWTHVMVALAAFVLGLAVAQWNLGYAPGHSRVVWPNAPHPRRLAP